MILFRYLARDVLVSTCVVAGIVLIISMGWRFSGYLEQAAAGMMRGDVLFVLMLYRMPGFLELIVPVSFFLSIMLVYGRMHVDNEMIVLQACGMSPGRLGMNTLAMSVLVMLFTAVIALWIKPLGEREVETLLVGQKNLTEFDTLVPGRFQALSSGRRVTYTGDIIGNGELKDVFINEYRDYSIENDPRNAVTVIAESGRTQVDELGRRFLVLKDGSRYQGRPGSRGYQIIGYEEYGQLVETDGASDSKRRASAIPTMELLRNKDAMSISELQWRVSIVMMIPVIALIGIPLSRVNPRQGRFTRLVPAMILCFVYVILLSGARSGVEKEDLPAELGLWWVHGLFLVILLAVNHLDRFSDLLNRVLAPR